MPTFTLTSTFVATDKTGLSFSTGPNWTGTTISQFDFSVPGSTTNGQYPCAFVRSGLLVVWMLASANCTVKTNSSGSPANTFSLIAGVPFLWDAQSAYFSDPYSADVTTIYVTTSTNAARLQILALYP